MWSVLSPLAVFGKYDKCKTPSLPGLFCQFYSYAFKYIQKGCDMATFELQQCDEIKRWLDGRYVSASEAAWRILHFEMHERSPNVVRLQVHLPGQHMVVFNPEDSIQTVVDRGGAEKTTLTAFFAANADLGPLGQEAMKYTYQEFPQHFVYKADKHAWQLRQRGFALGRMFFVAPTSGERFYLRTLLTVVKGSKSFADLRTYRGVQYETFQAACQARGLLEDDGEWRQCLHEAAEMQTGYVLRRLFATLLLFCSPADPATLWHDYRQAICIDLRHQLQGQLGPQVSEEDAYDYGLYLIDKMLQESGKSLAANWPTMPQPQQPWEHRAFNPLIAEHLSYDRGTESRKAVANVALLNEGQLAAYTTAMDSIANKKGNTFFLNGPGGTGKTFVYKTICHQVRANGWIILVVASSGIAAILMEGGRTAHSMFKIPVDNLNSGSYCSIPKEGQLAALLRQTHAIAWDEIGMQHRHGPEAVSRTLQDILGNSKPFGGITVIFGGDFQQILPVIPKGKKEDIVGATIQRSPLWRHTQILHLTQNMRLSQSQEDRDYAKWLAEVGHGHGISEKGTIHFSPDMRCYTPEELIAFVYPAIGSSQPLSLEYFQERMILAPRNVDVSGINLAVLQKMPGEERTYYSANKVIREEGVDCNAQEQPIPVEFLRSITGSGLPPGELLLKVGCPLILL